MWDALQNLKPVEQLLARVFVMSIAFGLPGVHGAHVILDPAFKRGVGQKLKRP